ncbi:Endonuclease 4 [Roseimaritima multifibrata]|uniref:Probable endonuclease 4 n=1 Tax=Roseimaritima multifibrata TaxID=1930274 RepID=A0A517MFI8_9BACT|nr:deoxyribonuclease IV [Roseimaritima multifibrata]QDS93650.1 Endonuclease 4 [Roseimaritima multifibrata]
MAIFGAHMSIAGGLYKAIERALAVDMQTLQIFTKNNNQWAAKPLTDEAIDQWKTAFAESKLKQPIAHASYLINLAAPDPALWQKSIDALVIELQRADQLQIDGLVLHPGAFTTSDEATGIARVIEGILAAFEAYPPEHCRLLLENTAGQGSCLGHTMDHLGQMIAGLPEDAPIGVCIDTCHAFAAGYAIETKAGFKQLKADIKTHLPAGSIRALHLNDSKKPCGSRVDRHDHIGLGLIGIEGFRNVLNDAMFKKLPGYLETPKGIDEESGEDWDVINLRALREVVK